MFDSETQWLRRRSLDGRLSPIDLRLTCDHSVKKWPLWVDQPGKLSLPSLWGRLMSSDDHITTWITRVATILRQTCVAYGCQPRVRARGRRPSLQL